MSSAVLTLHFRNEETPRDLERAAEVLGVSKDELAEAVIERELAAVGAGLEGRLARTLDRLNAYSPRRLSSLNPICLKDNWNNTLARQVSAQNEYISTIEAFCCNKLLKAQRRPMQIRRKK